MWYDPVEEEPQLENPKYIVTVTPNANNWISPMHDYLSFFPLPRLSGKLSVRLLEISYNVPSDQSIYIHGFPEFYFGWEGKPYTTMLHTGSNRSILARIPPIIVSQDTYLMTEPFQLMNGERLVKGSVINGQNFVQEQNYYDTKIQPGSWFGIIYQTLPRQIIGQVAYGKDQPGVTYATFEITQLDELRPISQINQYQVNMLPM